jgi:UTP--glucose-1-phosphate uridylyltransferase
MRALTGGAPKELIPVAGVPVLEWVARECAASGIEELLVVSAPGKEALEAHLAPLAGRAGMPRTIRFVLQHEPRGLADAMRYGRDFANGAPLAVALPDNLFRGERPGLAEVIESFDETGANVVAIVAVAAADAARRGATAIFSGESDGDLFRIAHIPDKTARSATFDAGGAAAAHTGVGRYVFTDELFSTIDAVERALPAGAELDDVPVMQSLLARGRLVGRLMRAHFLDIGLPAGYEEANTLLAGARP